ncbi:MAG TPA: DUF4398 domain-containing protein [Labilithrix sp.]|jgi:hypothetical protein|nr:DUF4398 domain-containing protein [Labilithrix sp.]
MKTIPFMVTAAALAGCATSPVPADKLARTQEVVSTAESIPATSTDAKAAEHLQLAKEQLRHAKRLMIEGDNDDARWALMRAESDAEAAISLAQAQTASADAQMTIEQVRQAMRSMQEKGDGQ